MAVGALYRTLGVLLRAARAGEAVSVKNMMVMMRIISFFIVDCGSNELRRCD